MSWWIARARGFRADNAHGILVAMGYAGSYRTTRRAVAAAKRLWQQKRVAAHQALDPTAGVVVAVGLWGRAEVAGVRAARGWRGRGFGSCCRWAISRCRR
jgi:hypothetical protein